MEFAANDALARLRAAHAQEVAELREEIERLQRQVQYLRSRGSSAADGGHGAQRMPARWHRFVLALLNMEETSKNLRLTVMQHERVGREGRRAIMDQALNVLEDPDHSVVNVAEAYFSVYAYQNAERTALWKASAVGLRTHVIWRCCCRTGRSDLESVEWALRRAFGPERYSRQAPDLRSQFLLAYHQIFPKDGNRWRAVRPTRSRSSEPTEAGPDRSASSQSSTRASSEQPAAAEEPQDREAAAAASAPAEAEPEMAAADVQSSKGPVRTLHHNGQVHYWTEESSQYQDTISVKSFPRTKRCSLAEKIRVEREKHRILNTLVDVEQVLPPEVSTVLAGKLLMFIEESPTLESQTTLVKAARHNAGNVRALRKLLEALWQVAGSKSLDNVQDLIGKFQKDCNPLAVAECCTMLSYFVWEGRDGQCCAEREDEVWSVLLATMEAWPDCAEVQESALFSLRSIRRVQGRVLGVCCARLPVAEADILVEPLRLRVRELATLAFERHEQCRELAVQVLARTQDLHTVQALAQKFEATYVSTMMDEIYYHLLEPLTAFSDPNPSKEKESWASSILQQLAQQQLSEALHASIMDWLAHMRWQPRFLLNAILTGVVDGVVQPLQSAVDAVSEDGVLRRDALSEDQMAGAFRALYELNDFVGPLPEEAREKVHACAIRLNEDRQSRGETLSNHLRSAIAGALGSLNRGRGMDSGDVLKVLLELSRGTLDLRWWNAASFHHELLWAFEQIFKGTSLGFSPATLEIRDLATKLLEKWGPLVKEDPQKTAEHQDEAAVVELANSILGLPTH